MSSRAPSWFDAIGPPLPGRSTLAVAYDGLTGVTGRS